MTPPPLQGTIPLVSLSTTTVVAGRGNDISTNTDFSRRRGILRHGEDIEVGAWNRASPSARDRGSDDGAEFVPSKAPMVAGTEVRLSQEGVTDGR